MVRAVHTNLAGRGRFSVEGLKGSSALKQWLEDKLVNKHGMLKASANTVTGNILVVFDPQKDHEIIRNLINHVITKFPGEDAPRLPEPVSKPAIKEPVPVKKPMAQVDQPLVALKEKVKTALAPLHPQPVEKWHTLTVEEVQAFVNTRLDSGISQEQVEKRKRRYGANALPESKPRSRWEIFAGQFMSLPTALLGAAAGVSILTGGLADAVIIMGVVVANAGIGYATESEAEKTIQSLKQAVHPSAEVIREGRRQRIPVEDVVIGDLLLLKPGTYVAADSRVIQAERLSIDESALTGESMPVYKKPRSLRLLNMPVADRTNMVFRGTLVTGGEGLAVVVATGAYTEIGRLQMLLDTTMRPESPMERQLRVMGNQLVIVSGGICGVVFVLGFLRGYGFLQMLRMGISLAAAAVPEGLPAAATINFALGIRKMRQHNVLVRHLQAIETLGAVQTVCLDKTGTITENRMTVVSCYVDFQRFDITEHHFATEQGPFPPLENNEIESLASVVALCNESRIVGGNGDGTYELKGSPTENALVHFAIRAGIDVRDLRDRYPIRKVNYRAENRLYMSTLHGTPAGGRKLAVKGSPSGVLELCGWHMVDGKRLALTEEVRLRLEAQNERMAGEALRVLGVACAESEDSAELEEMEGRLTWIGLVGMVDPIREGVLELIRAFHGAGIETVMITGDQSPTAYAVAKKLELSNNDHPTILDSMEFTSVQPDVMEALVQKVHVFSRVTPAHKLQIVQAFQGAGQTVAMTGDGINDAPALKAADLAIAMGHGGTDVAREVADVVLEDDNLETLIIAVQNGRNTYKNIRKSVHFFLSTNLSEIMVMFTAMAAGVGFPLNVMQLLWINIISDIFPGLALSMGEPDPDVMKEPPRDPDAPLFDKHDFKEMAYESGVISAATMGAYGVGLGVYGMGAKATSLAFQSLTFGQLLHAYSCRSESRGIFSKNRPPSNSYLNVAIGGSLGLQVLTMVVPGLRQLLGVAPLNLFDVAVVGGSAVLPLVINESRKEKKRKVGNER
jgi:Ca2+-transporting ATPase